MSPRRIVEEAVRKKIDILAISDHNTAGNVHATVRAAAGTSLVVLPGMEICTREEVHVLSVFGTPEAAMEMQTSVYDHLQGKNDPEVFGLQVIASEQDVVEGFEEKLLIGATDLSLDAVIRRVHELGGVVIAAHIDRQSNSVFSQLGFVPPGSRFDAMEITAYTTLSDARLRFRDCAAYTLVRNSDAHALDDIGKNITEYRMEAPSLPEIRKALQGTEGRTAIA